MEKDFESFYSKYINENELNDIWEILNKKRKRKN